MFTKIKFTEPVKLKDMTIGRFVLRYPMQIAIGGILTFQFVGAMF